MDKKVKEVRLPKAGAIPATGTLAVISGWGRMKVKIIIIFQYS